MKQSVPPYLSLRHLGYFSGLHTFFHLVKNWWILLKNNLPKSETSRKRFFCCMVGWVSIFCTTITARRDDRPMLAVISFDSAEVWGLSSHTQIFSSFFIHAKKIFFTIERMQTQTLFFIFFIHQSVSLTIIVYRLAVTTVQISTHEINEIKLIYENMKINNEHDSIKTEGRTWQVIESGEFS